VSIADTRNGRIANALAFQGVWFACVGGASLGHAWPGLLAALAFAAATLLWGGRCRADLRTLAIALPLGLGLDCGFAAIGWLHYPAADPWPLAAPPWIAALWVGFAMTLNHSLSFLRSEPRLAALLGLAGGPIAYWGAAQGFGVVSMAEPAGAVALALGLAWAAYLPLVFRLDANLPGRVALP
jgi:hypothetical protein